ncbi:MAG: ATP-binding protein [Actinobacteria bacterium HGW-Actinobacteria-7]|nr:MAG: ATP-binding protein [Actinobacteria bacterium HGW-Actinobacteria-7]
MTDDNSLLNFVASVSGDAYLKVEENLGDGFVVLKVSEAERRQAKHDIRSVEDIVVELLRNSRDAHAQRIFLATGRDGDQRTITVIDDGVGVPLAMQQRIFDPRVTSKLETMVMDRWGVHGRGMALFSIKSNTSEARLLASGLHKGASIGVVADAATLTERSDQSTWPSLEKDESGVVRVARGPHNIVRRTVEFSLEHPGIDVFIGSPSEVLSTLVMLARFEMDESELLFCEDLKRLPVWQRPGAAADAGELADTAAEVGLGVSERTAHRVLAGEITPLRSVLSTASGAVEPAGPSAPDIYRDRRGLKIHHSDLAAFRSELESAFDAIAEKYYLHLRCEPKITVGREDIRVRFEVDKED